MTTFKLMLRTVQFIWDWCNVHTSTNDEKNLNLGGYGHQPRNNYCQVDSEIDSPDEYDILLVNEEIKCRYNMQSTPHAHVPCDVCDCDYVCFSLGMCDCRMSECLLVLAQFMIVPVHRHRLAKEKWFKDRRSICRFREKWGGFTNWMWAGDEARLARQ